MKDLLKLLDLSREEIFRILDVADQLKYDQHHRIPHRFLEGRTLAMIFSKNSTRTRVSFESGMFQLGDQFRLCHDPKQAIAGAEVVFTDAWTSMGREREPEARRKIFQDYQLNDTLLSYAAPDCLVQHCLPAHRGEEVTAEVFEAHAEEIFEEAENRLHVQKAVLCLLMDALPK